VCFLSKVKAEMRGPTHSVKVRTGLIRSVMVVCILNKGTERDHELDMSLQLFLLSVK
jgi:hypothetical protein